MDVGELQPYRVELASGYYSVMLCCGPWDAKERATELAERKGYAVVLIERLEE